MSINTIVETLTAVIADSKQPTEERDRATAVLKFYSAKEKEHPAGLVTDDRVVAGMLARVAASTLWTMPDKYCVETVTLLDCGRVARHPSGAGKK
jgi:hypothetical protein